ncbi:MAG TPA: hypothetical protein VEC97_00310 [Candidatus Acidoferrales bacterium]|nr:hypothetical protein [Candidatus Acidoferrales bacterium]
MRKATWMFTMLVVAMIFCVSMSFNTRSVGADGTYTIPNVDHTVSVLSNGYVLMNDTIMLSGQAPSSFLLGFPYTFGSYVLSCVASDASNSSNTFPVSLSEPLEGRVGFYGIEVDFPNGAPQAFSVQVLFSTALVEQDPNNSTLYAVNFPMFPSLETSVDTFNGSIILPTDAVYEEGTISNLTSDLTYSQTNLAAFAYNTSAVEFNIPNYEMQVYDVNRLTRQITVSPVGDITGTDSYYVTNWQVNSSLSSVDVLLPPNATQVSAQDQFGRTMSPPTQDFANMSTYTVTFSIAVDPASSTLFTVTYSLPSQIYLESQGANSFALSMTMFQDLDYYVNSTTVTFILPQGATLQSFANSLVGGTYGISKSVFQEEIVMNAQDMSSLNSFSVRIVYGYSPLWLGYGPTIWVLVLSMIGCLAVVVLRRPKAPMPVTALPTAGMRVQPEYIRSFVDSYEERMKIASEIDSLESKAKKGRIPRQRYKVQRRTLETRLTAVSRSLNEARERMRAAGGHYAGLMRELEVAETGMNEVETSVTTIEARHSRGELSLEAYRKLLGDYQRRKEKAEAAMNAVLLRLREEIG